MPVKPTYPGVYIEEIPSGVRTITGVATSVAAFVDRAGFAALPPTCLEHFATSKRPPLWPDRLAPAP